MNRSQAIEHAANNALQFLEHHRLAPAIESGLRAAINMPPDAEVPLSGEARRLAVQHAWLHDSQHTRSDYQGVYHSEESSTTLADKLLKALADEPDTSRDSPPGIVKVASADGTAGVPAPAIPHEFKVGDRVILGRHEEINGYTNWVNEMDQYIGTQATITSLEEIRWRRDDLTATVDTNHWHWRLCNMKLVTPTPTTKPERTEEEILADYERAHHAFTISLTDSPEEILAFHERITLAAEFASLRAQKGQAKS